LFTRLIHVYITIQEESFIWFASYAQVFLYSIYQLEVQNRMRVQFQDRRGGV